MCIPGVMIFKIVTTEGTLQEVIIPQLFSLALEVTSRKKSSSSSFPFFPFEGNRALTRQHQQ